MNALNALNALSHTVQSDRPGDAPDAMTGDAMTTGPYRGPVMASYRQGVSPMEPVGEGQLVLVIEPVPGNVPAVNRLRRLLKVMLRGYGWRCVHVGRREPATVVYVERKKRTRPAKPCPDR